MTHIVSPTRYPTKKSFHTAVMADAEKVYVEDPSMFSPCHGTVAHVAYMVQHFTVTNHPKRSWFAEVSYNGGQIKVK